MTYHSDPVPFWCPLDPAFRDALAGALWADDMGQVLGLDAAMRLLAPARRSVVLAQGSDPSSLSCRAEPLSPAVGDVVSCRLVSLASGMRATW